MSNILANAPVVVNGAAYAITAPSPRLIEHDKNSSCTIFTVRPGDQAPYDRQRGRPYERVELINLSAFAFGKPATISYFQYIAPGSAATRPAIIGQIHNTAVPNSGPQPYVAMRVNGAFQYIVTNSGKGPDASRKSIVRWSAPVIFGRWIRWTWQFTPDRVDTRLQIWRDGIPIFNTPIQLGGFTDPRGPYWQFGIYRSKDSTTMRVAYASVSVRPGKYVDTSSTVDAPTCPVAPVAVVAP